MHLNVRYAIYAYISISIKYMLSILMQCTHLRYAHEYCCSVAFFGFSEELDLMRSRLHWNNFVFANVLENHTCPSRCCSHSLNVAALNSSQLTRRLWSVFDSCFLILWHFHPKPPAHQQREKEREAIRMRARARSSLDQCQHIIVVTSLPLSEPRGKSYCSFRAQVTSLMFHLHF